MTDSISLATLVVSSVVLIVVLIVIVVAIVKFKRWTSLMDNLNFSSFITDTSLNDSNSSTISNGASSLRPLK